MNLQEELKALNEIVAGYDVLKQRIYELEEQAKEQQVEQTKEFPQNGDDYWYVDDDTEVMDIEWDGSDCDQDRLSIDNVFRTKEGAEFAAEKLKVEAELRKFSRPFVDDNDNYFIKINSYYKYLTVDSDDSYRTQGTIYFESMEIANEAIDAVGADRIKKYLFGVEG